MMKPFVRYLASVALLATSATAQSNLIVNGDFSAGNTGFTSDYQFKSTFAPPNLGAGQYQITTNATSSHSLWTNVVPHSGTQFFIANGSEDTNLSPWMQTITITPQSITVSEIPGQPVYYRFQAYISSVFDDNPLRLSFEMSLNGSDYWQTLTTSPPPVTTGLWYLTYKDGWFAEAPTSISFRLRNAEAAPLGNDFGIDSIYFGLSSAAPSFSDNIDSFGEISVVPEPSTALLGLLGSALLLRRKRNA